MATTTMGRDSLVIMDPENQLLLSLSFYQGLELAIHFLQLIKRTKLHITYIYSSIMRLPVIQILDWL